MVEQATVRVLIVEDDPDVCESMSLAFAMRWRSASVETRDTGGAGLDALSAEPFDLVILDVNLPDTDGFTVLKEIRQRSSVPVIMVTVQASETERVRGLELGADDYVAKPFSPLELLARAAAVLRRSSDGSGAPEPKETMLEAAGIQLNPDTAEVRVEGRSVQLSPTEFKVLSILLRNQGKVVSRDQICSEVWGISPGQGDSYLVKLHIQHLRRKIGDSGVNPRYIGAVRGFGYRMLV